MDRTDPPRAPPPSRPTPQVAPTVEAVRGSAAVGAEAAAPGDGLMMSMSDGDVEALLRARCHLPLISP